MDNNKDIIFRLLSIVCVVMGAYFLLNSTNLGDNQASNYVMMMGGSVNTEALMVHFKAYSETYRIFGGILLAVGLIRLLKKY
ncbi:hypothetical protein WJ0W_000829 [Paenibacillus melissococcoides]|uniref:Uncharacterized protein n=1 Tax=Paenibacillus melissococcoides TaxID=2912268 RepID=A0ABM9FWQ1_9BACL|nr:MULTISPECIES: hypothetical protein [Paenibacillus]MEB9896152.1 hypothetical protein [Bacillus cereus]CAH8243590.1 hypothetical protein WJ0W_000829 [Paenibacillus melissococcoides]CAH8704956.1 hypothetical protein WDD9_000814 [Paenibacillus melissococcoides]CAH8708183.1 hypothetical protein HTL2_001900 [Paenibacillus melissococcoides]GIO79955.1 hypothetical protein J6TS7_35650 [Paenibacillus dendritiformis]